MNELAFPIVVMLLMVTGEAVILRWVRRQTVDWHDVVFNLNAGHIVLWLFRGLEVLCYGLVSTYLSLDLLDAWPSWAIWAFAFLAWDFCFYWLHRFHHHVSVLWAVHVVHHQGEHFNLSLGVRNSWYSSLTSIPFFVVLALLGVPLHVFVAVSILHYSMQFFNHNALTPTLGVLEKLFVTPAHHRVHHIKDRAYSDKNFGGTFILWDKLFGTFSLPPPTHYTYGVGGPRSSANPFWASNVPLLRYLRLSIVPDAKHGSSRVSGGYVFSGALLLFALVIGYIYQYGYGYEDVHWPQVVLFIALVVGSLALGGMSEAKAWSVPVWLLVGLGLPCLFLGYCGWSQRYWQWPMIALAVHCLGVALFHRHLRLPAILPGDTPHG
ncbi:sterol desaturase family protein [Pseudomonas monteilii]